MVLHLPAGAPKNASYRSYVEGKGPDGVEKTPEWAAEITGVPANQIRKFAREVALAQVGCLPALHCESSSSAQASTIRPAQWNINAF